MPRTRPPYPPEFRLEAVRLLRAGVRTPRQLAAELGCSEQTLRNWLRQDRLSVASARTCSRARSGSGCASSSAKTRCCARSARS